MQMKNHSIILLLVLFFLFLTDAMQMVMVPLMSYDIVTQVVILNDCWENNFTCPRH